MYSYKVCRYVILKLLQCVKTLLRLIINKLYICLSSVFSKSVRGDILSADDKMFLQDYGVRQKTDVVPMRSYQIPTPGVPGEVEHVGLLEFWWDEVDGDVQLRVEQRLQRHLL